MEWNGGMEWNGEGLEYGMADWVTEQCNLAKQVKQKTNLLSSGSCWQLAYLMLNAAHCLISQALTPLTVFGESREVIVKTHFAALILRLNFDTYLIPSDVTSVCQINNKALLFSLSVLFDRLTNWKGSENKESVIGLVKQQFSISTGIGKLLLNKLLHRQWSSSPVSMLQ